MQTTSQDTPEASSVTAQQRFDELYITSTEVSQEMGVPRATVLYARRRGLLPDPITINDKQIYLWERATVRPYMEAWKLSLACRRGELV